MKGYHDSKTKIDDRDCWQTPRYIFDHFNQEYEFTVDVAASADNSLCDKFITKEDDAIKSDWLDYAFQGDFVWCNPPYSKPREFIDKAVYEASVNKIGCVMLLPADTSVKWFAEILKTASEVILLTEGRVSFISPETGKPKNGNNKGSLIAVWEPYFIGECRITHASLKEMKENGTN